MTWRLKGEYLANCSCAQICACSIDGQPTGPNGECMGVAVFRIDEGSLDTEDLSGVTFAMYNYFPSNLTAGRWKIGLVVHDGAKDEQAKCIERIVAGQEGGMFAEFVPLVSEFLGTDRAPVTLLAGKKPTASVGTISTLSLEPILAPDGTPTVIRGAPYAFAPEYQFGKAGGRSSKALGSFSFDHVYGETARYEYTSEGAEQVKGRA